MRIDVHHHWIARDHHDTAEKFMRRDEKLVRTETGWRIQKKGVHLTSSEELFWNMERQVENMDACRIDKSILFLAGWQEWDTMKSCAYQNDYLAGIVQRYPKRFFGIAHVPPIGGKAAMKELERAIRGLGFKGATITTHNRSLPLDSERMFPFYETVAGLDVPVVVTPYSYYTETHPLKGEADFLGASLARLENTHRATVRLVYSGVMDRFPDLKFLLPHMGATFFAVRNRLSPSSPERMQVETGDYSLQAVDDPAARHLERLYFDTAPPFWKDWEIKCAIQSLGEDQICFGSDYPIHPRFLEQATAIMENLDVEERVKQKVWGGNAARLFRLVIPA